MNDNMILIMIDECGDEVEVARYTIGDELDDDYLTLWKEQKYDKVRERYPEARGFYFEDRRGWNRQIYASMRGEWD
jgi:hypothetical protein